MGTDGTPPAGAAIPCHALWPRPRRAAGGAGRHVAVRSKPRGAACYTDACQAAASIGGGHRALPFGASRAVGDVRRRSVPAAGNGADRSVVGHAGG